MALQENIPQPCDYTIGWICAIKVEYVAAQEFLDEEYKGPASVLQHDNNSYTLGKIGEHNVVIATLPCGEYGTTSAATVARDMVHSFPNIRIGLMVGIGGGAPSEIHDIRLGDIVVSTPSNGNGGLFQYDFGKNIQGQPYQTTGVLSRPPAVLLTALARLQSQYERKGHKLEEAIDDKLRNNRRLQRKYKRPDSSNDRLYRSEIVHPQTKGSCAAVCDPSGLILRSEREEDEDNPAIHYGLIASANQLMKNALDRDTFAAEKGVLCFEMEAAGLMNHFPCLVIRGICDYSDSHKNKEWQGYAAMVAAAYAKDLLYQIPLHTVQAEKRLSDVLSGLHEAIEEHRDSMQSNLQTQKDLAQQKSEEEERKERQKCHQLFRLTATDKDTTYEWYKDRVENRVEDTCLWFLNHAHFKKWLEQDSGPLLVTADPGCGKSVLAKYLIDYILPQSTATVCYFFFKDQDQNTIRQALCALLHQIFSAKPSLIAHAIPEYRISGRSLINSTESLWKILHNAMQDLSNRESVIIVLDALDECAETEFEDLMRNVKRQFSDNQMGRNRLKYLLTCRPYEQIVSRFSSLLNTFPYIRIPGEEESDAISREVDLVITYQVDLLARDKLLSFPIKNALEKRLKQTTHRTYLWIYLIFDYLKKENFKKTEKAIMSIIITLPRTINEAYKHILSKSKDDSLAGKALRIVLAASRPLTVSEMNTAVNIDFQSTRDLDLEDNVDFETRLRSCCGLFISIYHGKVYFLHQTAREFLIDTELLKATSQEALWYRSITMRNAHAILAEICVLYLNLFDNDGGHLTDEATDGSHTFRNRDFFNYSARFWSAHFREANFKGGDSIIRFALRICDSNFKWFRIYADSMPNHPSAMNRRIDPATLASYTDLMVAVYCGHHVLAQSLLQQGADVEAKHADGWTPLLWASFAKEREAVVEVLLEKGADAEARGGPFECPALIWASRAGNEAVVKLLLQAGANINTADNTNFTPLSIAALWGHEAVVKLLLENGANIEAGDRDYRTPLLYAAWKGNEAVVKLLLENGANIEVADNQNFTPLSIAALRRHEAVVKLLLENGANIEAADDQNFMPLSFAAFKGNKVIVKLLERRSQD